MDDWQGKVIVEKIKHYDNVRQDLRDEIKCRISQRDNFSVQYFIAVCAIVLGGLTQSFYLFLMLPIVSLYYVNQILYSYSIHDKICHFLSAKIDNKIATLLEEDPLLEWESYMLFLRKQNLEKTPGIRRNFFIFSMWASSYISIAAFVIVSLGAISTIKIVLFASIAFLLCTGLNVYTVYRFLAVEEKKNR